MRCPVCRFVLSDEEDLCLHCLTDLRMQKAAAGLKIARPEIAYSELLVQVERERASVIGIPPLPTGASNRTESRKSPSSTPKTQKPLLPLKEELLHEGALFAERFYICRLLGEGSVGRVFEAQDSLLGGERVALKILRRQLAQDPENLHSFLRELRLARNIQSPYVVRMYDASRYHGEVFFTMEFVRGQSLTEFIADVKYTPLEACRLLFQIVSGLEAIHQAGIMHRDLKSDNILVTPPHSAKIGDFGVAYLGSAPASDRAPLVGSAAYMAPEVWKGEEVTRQADLYSLGVVAYELFVGTRPFAGETQAMLLLKHLTFNPIPPHLACPTIPEPLSLLLMDLLEKDPAKRPEDVSELRQRLESALG